MKQFLVNVSAQLSGLPQVYDYLAVWTWTEERERERGVVDYANERPLP